jgi:hypothetical protein
LLAIQQLRRAVNYLPLFYFTQRRKESKGAKLYVFAFFAPLRETYVFLKKLPDGPTLADR